MRMWRRASARRATPCARQLSTLVLPSSIRINEVGPRDGLQNERLDADVATPARRATLARMLLEAGCGTVEAVAFVREDKVPAMAGAKDVLKHLRELGQKRGTQSEAEWARYVALVPNVRGVDKALEAGAASLAVVTCVSDAFAQKNVGAKTWLDNLRLACEAAAAARQRGAATVRGYISCAFACPYDTPTRADDVAHSAAALADAGCTEVVLGDTDGRAGVRRLGENVAALGRAGVGVPDVGVHFHDTFGQAVANAYAALALGVTSVDASCAGLGGCPFAPGASGNLATEDLAFFLQGAGVDGGVDARKLLAAARYAHALASGDAPVLSALERSWSDGVPVAEGLSGGPASRRAMAGRALRAWPRRLGEAPAPWE